MTMESSGPAKRSADSEPNSDTYAVCTSCGRLSVDLRTCDRCGSTLSAENSASCYSAEPKRARTEPASDPAPDGLADSLSSNTVVNGDTPVVNGNSPRSNAPSPDSINLQPVVPVPQALYKNKNVTEDVRPQALFSNLLTHTNATTAPPVVNNSLQPVLAAASGTLNNSTLSSISGGPSLITSPVISINNLLSSVRPSLSSNLIVTSSAGMNLLPSSSGPIPTAIHSANPQPFQGVSSAGFTPIARVTLPSYNLQPPAPPHYPLSSAQRPVENNASIPPPNQVAPSASNHINNAAAAAVAAAGSNPIKLSVEPHCVSIPAQQIRIGAQKFKPLTAVSFKDDGILFTLKDYTYAPVLLNARAILRCRANMNLLQYPVFLLFLEASCMRQIRNIFGLKDEDFNDNSPCELKRCISIFPSITVESAKEVINKNVVLELARMFGLMEKRYMRYNKILEEMTPEEGLDIMLALLTSKSTPTNPPSSGARPMNSRTNSTATTSAAALTAASAAPRGMSQQSGSRPPPPLQNNTLPHGRAAAPMAGFPNPSAMASNFHRPGILNSGPRTTVPPISTGSTHKPVFRATNPAGPRGPPTLQVPQDEQKWQELQKSLVVGGVYHVQQPGANRQTMYCLWNGTQLVPCLVQNTEVQLDCDQVWVGTFRAKATSHLRVKADNQQGLFVTIDKDNRGGCQKELHIPLGDIVQCHVCMDQRISCMFVDLSDRGAEKLRNILKMSNMIYTDPAYSPRATEEKKKHFILFLKNVNNDQWEALTSMKFSGRHTTMFIKCDILKALKILADIKANSKVQSKIMDWLSKKSIPANLIAVENIAKELCNPNDKSVDHDDDDDDDVIMTQEEVGIKCPYTQQVMKEPIRNKICGHNYEKAAINEFMVRKKGNAKCPYAGCGNSVPLVLQDLEDNYQLKEYIRKNMK